MALRIFALGAFHLFFFHQNRLYLAILSVLIPDSIGIIIVAVVALRISGLETFHLLFLINLLIDNFIFPDP